MRFFFKKSGFTLIELMVVISIISMLASIVLASLNSARNKGRDARVISDLQQIRLSIFAGYDGFFFPDLRNDVGNCNTGANILNANFAQCGNVSGPDYANINNLTKDVLDQNSTVLYSVNSSGNAYSVRGRMVSDQNVFFCIDSTGQTNAIDNANISPSSVGLCH